jgi:beta-glucanase (GH16 family)
MKKLLITAFILHLTLNSIYSQYVPFINAPDKNKKWNYETNLSDEFNSSTIDWKNKFYMDSNLPNVNAWKWNNATNVTIVNNAAQISMRHNQDNIPVNGTYFNSGILKTKGTFTTGYVEAKIKGAVMNIPGQDNGRGVCPSFWLYSDFDRSAEEGKTVYCEIDVVELQQFDYYNNEQDDVYDMEHNLHLVLKESGKDVWYRPKANAATQKNHYTAPFDPTQDYHIYGCEVTETQITWYVDGVQVGSKPNTYWYRPMNVTLSLGLRVPFVVFKDNRFQPTDPTIPNTRANKQLAAIPATMSVDYMRVWTHKSKK